VLEGTWSSASKNRRKHTVDSRELFELLADGDMKGLQGLTGYGAITWMVPGSDEVALTKLSASGSLVVASVKSGGVVWASTKDILESALSKAELSVETYYDIEAVGNVFMISAEGVFTTKTTGVKVGDSWKNKTYAYGWGDSDSYDWRDWLDTEDEDRAALTKTRIGSAASTYSGSAYTVGSRSDLHGYGSHLYWNRQTQSYETKEEWKKRTDEEDRIADEEWAKVRARNQAKRDTLPAIQTAKDAAKSILQTGGSGLTTEEASSQKDGRIYYDTAGTAFITTLNGQTWKKPFNGAWEKVKDAPALPRELMSAEGE